MNRILMALSTAALALASHASDTSGVVKTIPSSDGALRIWFPEDPGAARTEDQPLFGQPPCKATFYQLRKENYLTHLVHFDCPAVAMGSQHEQNWFKMLADFLDGIPEQQTAPSRTTSIKAGNFTGREISRRYAKRIARGRMYVGDHSAIMFVGGVSLDRPETVDAVQRDLARFLSSLEPRRPDAPARAPATLPLPSRKSPAEIRGVKFPTRVAGTAWTNNSGISCTRFSAFYV